MRTKSFFLSMLAVAGMLFVSSCAQDDAFEGASSNYVNATFTLSTEDAVGTRAMTTGNGTKADEVVCAIFDANGDEMDLRQAIEVKDKKATYVVRLAKGQSYRAVFFAYNKAAAAYDVTDLKNVEIKGGQNANIEERDAFTAVVDITADETLNSVTKTVVLRRPFALLNLGISKDEFVAAKKSGVEVFRSSITVSNVYSTFNAFSNTVVEGTDGEVTFAMDTIPAEMLEVDLNRDGAIDADKEVFHYLALNYLLVGDSLQEKKLTDVEFRWENEDGSKTNTPATTFINIPVQRNYRTNIIGNLITSPATFNIVIDERFESETDPSKRDYIVIEEDGTTKAIIKKVEDLQDALNNATGNTIVKFDGDIDATKTRSTSTAATIIVPQKEGVNLVIDGCGYKFDGTFYLHGAARHEGAETLTFTNINFEHAGGTLDFISANSTASAERYAHNVLVENCTFTGNNNGDVVGMRYRQCYNMEVRNCTFKNMHSAMWATGTSGITVDNVTTENCKNGVSFGTSTGLAVMNSKIVADEAYGVRTDGSVKATLDVENSTINAAQPVIVRNLTGEYTVNLSNNKFETTEAYHVVLTNGADDAAYVAPTGAYTLNGAEGYNVYPVEEGAVLEASNPSQFVAILESGNDVKMLGDVKIEPANMSNAYGKTGINVKNGQTVDGGGNVLDVKGAGGTWDSGINTTGGLIKDITVTGSFRGIFINHNSSHYEKVVLENVIIAGTTYTISCDQGNNQGLEATDCTFNGWTSYAATLGEAKFNNCKFGKGNGYAYCRPYAPTVFENCEFEAGYTLDPRANVVLKNCTLGGVAITADNVAELVTNTSNVTVEN